jgi:hypothetical protein
MPRVRCITALEDPRMEVIVDGERQTFDLSECANLAELVARAERTDADGDPSVVVGVEIDGERLSSDALGELETVGLEGLGRVSIERRSARSVACSVLTQASDYAERVVAAIDQTVAHFRGGRTDRGNALLADVSDSLSVLTGITGSVAMALPGAAAALAEVQEDLFPWLEAMVEAQTEQDPLGIADLLEYELRDRIAGWGDLLQRCARSSDELGAPSCGPEVSN